jgi:hypothetical protein
MFARGKGILNVIAKDAGKLLPLPKEFQRHTLHPFRK